MTTQVNKSAGVKFEANMIEKTRGFEVSYAKGLSILVPKTIVNNAQQATQGFVDALVTAETAMKKAFDDVVAVAKKKGLARSDAGKVIALILGVPSISKAHDDAAIAMSIKLKWQYAARDLVSNRGQVNAGRKDESEKGVIVADDASETKPSSLEELLVNKKYVEFGSLVASRIKGSNDRTQLILALLADATADEVEAISNAIIAPHKKLGVVTPPRRTKKLAS
jgi:hypothetical protein